MAKQRNYSAEFKCQVVQEYLAGETLYGLSKRHDVSRNVIRLWIARYEAGGQLNDDTTAADLLAIFRVCPSVVPQTIRTFPTYLPRQRPSRLPSGPGAG